MIVGGGGFAREAMDVVDAVNAQPLSKRVQHYEVLGFVDDGEPNMKVMQPYGLRHLGAISSLEDFPPDVIYTIGIGSPQARRAIDQRFSDVRDSPVLVHPSATVARAVTVGPGTVVCAGARITNNVRIGRHVHVNLNSTIGHDAVLRDYVAR